MLKNFNKIIKYIFIVNLAIFTTNNTNYNRFRRNIDEELYNAVKNNQIEKANILIDNGAIIDKYNIKNIITWAFHNNNINLIKKIITKYPLIIKEVKDILKYCDNEEITQLLIKNGLDIEFTDNENKDSIFQVVTMGRYNILRLLIKNYNKEIDPYKKESSFQNTKLEYCIQYIDNDRIKIAKLLILKYIYQDITKGINIQYIENNINPELYEFEKRAKDILKRLKTEKGFIIDFLKNIVDYNIQNDLPIYIDIIIILTSNDSEIISNENELNFFKENIKKLIPEDDKNSIFFDISSIKYSTIKYNLLSLLKETYLPVYTKNNNFYDIEIITNY